MALSSTTALASFAPGLQPNDYAIELNILGYGDFAATASGALHFHIERVHLGRKVDFSAHVNVVTAVKRSLRPSSTRTTFSMRLVPSSILLLAYSHKRTVDATDE